MTKFEEKHGVFYFKQEMNDYRRSPQYRGQMAMKYYRAKFGGYSNGRQNIDDYVDALKEGKEMADRSPKEFTEQGVLHLGQLFTWQAQHCL